MQSNIPTITDVYLLTLCGMFERQNLDPMLQQATDDTGRIFLARKGTTIPECIVNFKFEQDAVLLRVQTRSEREQDYRASFAEGIDATLQEISKFIAAGRLTNKSKAA